jgi:hypothetical protein
MTKSDTDLIYHALTFADQQFAEMSRKTGREVLSSTEQAQLKRLIATYEALRAEQRTVPDNPARRELSDPEALNLIAQRLSGQEWACADDLEYVAELVRSTGRSIEELGNRPKNP